MKKILLFLLAFVACAYSAQAQDCIYIVGDGNGLLGWKDPTSANASAYEPYKLAKVSENVFEGTFTLNGNVYFRFYKELTGYDGGASLGAPDGGGDWNLTSQVGTNDLQIVLGKQRNWYLGADGSEYLFTVNLNTNTLRVSRVLYLRGAWTDKWDAEPAYKFNCDKGVYTLTVDGDFVKNKGWQIATSNWSYKYGVGSAITTTEGTTLTSGSNAGFGELEKAKYDLEYTFSTSTLKVTKQGTDPDPEPEYPENIYYYYSSSSDMLEIAAKDQANGVYEATLTIAENASFRFYSNSNKADDYSYGPTNTSANVAISLGENVEMKNTSTKRWELTNTAGEYTFTVDLKNKTFTVVAKSGTPDPEFTKYYLRGDINGWGTSEDWELKTTDGLTYTLNNVTLVSGQEFKIGQAGKSGWVGYGYGSTAGELSIYPDGTGYKIYKDNSGNLKFDYVYDRLVNITFTLASIDSNEATLKVVYVDGAEITYPTLYLRGDFSGSWKTNDAYKFTKSGDVYTLTVKGNDVKNKEWAIATDDYTYNFGVSEAITVTDGTKLSWNTNKGAQAGFGELEDAKYVLEYTYSTQTLKVTKQGAVVTYPGLWLRGDFNNWGNDGPEANTAYKFTCTDGVYTLTVEAGTLSDCKFKIGSSETSGDWTIGFGGKDADVTAQIGEAFTVYDAEGYNNIYIAENSYKFDIKFVPDFANNTGELTISINNPSGIEDVEISNEAPVEFYNLQGVRVDGELTPGLYIRRQGNSASKVLIR